MVGTLVVSLPSTHTGGELVIDHAGETRTYRASKEDLTLVALYSDCRHEVKPVRSGYRVTLTFNLLADTETPTPEAGPATELAHCLTEHFTTPATPRYGGQDLDPPNRLVFLLDHEYTQRGLTWHRLKGVDAERAALVRAAAERAGVKRGRQRASTRSRGTARGGSPRSSRDRDGRTTTGRSHGWDAGASCATHWPRSSAPGHGAPASGRSRRTDAGTCTPRSTQPACPYVTRPDDRAGHTHSCSRKPTSCSPAPGPRDTPPRPTWHGRPGMADLDAG